MLSSEGNVDLGTVEVDLLLGNASFERPRNGLGDHDKLTSTGGCKLVVRPTQSADTLLFEVSGLPRLREMKLEFYVDSLWRRTFSLSVVRTIPFSWVALSAVPLAFFFRHFAAEWGNLTTAVASAAPWLGSLLLERLAPIKAWRLSRFTGLCFIAALLLIYLGFRLVRPFEAVISQDDERIVHGARQSAGTVRDGDTITWDPERISDLELSDFCVGDSFSVCAVRSSKATGNYESLQGVPLPRKVPFRVSAALVGAGEGTDRSQDGPLAHGTCSLWAAGRLDLRLVAFAAEAMRFLGA